MAITHILQNYQQIIHMTSQLSVTTGSAVAHGRVLDSRPVKGDIREPISFI